MRDKCPIFPDYKKRKEKKFTGILVSLKIQISTFSISYIMGDPTLALIHVLMKGIYTKYLPPKTSSSLI